MRTIINLTGVLLAMASGLLTETNAALTNAISPGQIVIGSITNTAETNYYSFLTASNDVVALTLLRTNGTGTTSLSLYDPMGTLIFADPGNGIVVNNPSNRLTKTGTYTLGVVASNLNVSYDYTLCMIKIPGQNIPEPGECQELLWPNETCPASIAVGDLDAYRLHAIAGDTITLILQKTSGNGLSPVMRLYSQDGNLLTAASASNSARIRISCVSQTTGDYYVVIQDDGLNEGFGYELTLSQYPVIPPSSGATQYLAIFQCTNHVIVRWETNSAGFHLESAERPCSVPGGPPNLWSPVNTPPRIIADQFYVDIGAVMNGSQFFRLRCTNCPPAFVGE